MKKILVLLVSFFALPFVTLAINYDIKDFYIDAKVLENGDMEVSELILLKGTFNGYERDIVYSNSYANSNLNASGIKDLNIKSIDTKSISFDTFGDNFDEYILTNYATEGDRGKYQLFDLNGGKRVRMYNRTDHSSTAFLIKYTLNDVAILHNGFGEVYWNFIGNDFEDEIENLKIRVSLPGEDKSDYFRIWAHGPMNGEVNFINKDALMASTVKLPANTAVDVRFTFSSSLLNSGLVLKRSNETLDEIISHEQVLADEANKQRLELKRTFYATVGVTILFYLFTIVAWIYVYFKYDKERKPKFNLEYNREFIDDYNVEVVDYLMNKNVSENALSASIMNLVYKKNIVVEELDHNKKIYKFILKNRDNLNDTENKLLDFLFVKVGNNNEFTTVELKKYASGTKTCNTFMNTYTAWKNSVIKDGEAQGFFENKSSYIGFSILAVVFGGLLTFFTMMMNVEFFPANIAILVGILFLAYTLLFSKKTIKGIEHYARWMAFKKFLEDFGNFSVKELPEIKLWERYLVYATVFGLADNLEKVMNVKISEMDINDVDIYYGNNFWFNYHMAHLINSSIHSAISSSQATINRMNAESAMSSGSGFGGGFSGGGGFGGGGGGGRGF